MKYMVCKYQSGKYIHYKKRISTIANSITSKCRMSLECTEYGQRASIFWSCCTNGWKKIGGVFSILFDCVFKIFLWIIFDLKNHLQNVANNAPSKLISTHYASSKGQLISEWLLDVFIWTKKRTKICLHFCPISLK